MNKSASNSLQHLPTAGLVRRLAALLYDSMLLLALELIAGFLFLLVSRGEAVTSGDPLAPYLQTYRFLIAFFFFAWFWTHGGQTLGMRAWRLRVQNDNGEPLTWGQALLRFMSGLTTLITYSFGLYCLSKFAQGLFGLTPMQLNIVSIVAFSLATASMLWILVDKNKLAWHDRFSDSRIVVLPKPQKTTKKD